jgi:hypothetical protein
VKIAVEGVDTFKKENCDLIIVIPVVAINKKLLSLKKCVKFLKQRFYSLILKSSVLVP